MDMEASKSLRLHLRNSEINALQKVLARALGDNAEEPYLCKEEESDIVEILQFVIDNLD